MQTSSYCSDAVRTRKLQQMKEKYSNLSREERQKRVQKSAENRAKRIAQNSEQNGNIATNQRRRVDWLLRAASDAYETESASFYVPSCSELHKLNDAHICAHCGAKKFEFEWPTFCCDNGKVKLAQTKVPPELEDLFVGQSEEAKEFRKNIRGINCMFSFTSFGVNYDKELASSKRGVYTFKVQGQVYHDLPGLIPGSNGPCYFQLYFHDTTHEIQNRMNIIKDANVHESLIKKIKKILEDNPYAKVFTRLQNFSSMQGVQLHISKDAKLDQRVYNSPTVDQVAAIWIEGNNSNIPIEREIIVHSHSGHKHNVKHYYGCYDPLQYPLLLPMGEMGWLQNIPKINSKLPIPSSQVVNKNNRGRINLSPPTEILQQPVLQQEQSGQSNLIPTISTSAQQAIEQEDEGESNLIPTIITSAQQVIEQEDEGILGDTPNKVSCREYYCYKFQIRTARQSTLLHAGRLFQQYAVDQYIKLETTRLDFYRRKQSELRADLYQGIVDSVMAGESRGSEIGQLIILPASFIGGARDMRRRYLDAMSLVGRFGKPDLFITMTCNTEWPEIQNELLPGQHSQDRPDLTARIFRAKLQDLKDQLFKKEIFGKVAAHVHVIEFQKRGLPHAHLLVILKSGYKITTPDQFDKFVCAELPDETKYSLLHNLVVKHMMHGPCGEKNKSNSCMIDGKCKCHYPRDFCERTVQGEDGYPIYRRRQDKRTVRVRNAQLNNQWVVPYNPYLLTRYNCHINVEICSGVQAVKYLYKYIYKGHDRVAVNVSQNSGQKQVDEIKQFQDARWVSAPEALWRIFEYNLNEIYPAVINLVLHLPNKQFVTYWKNEELKKLITWDHVSKTMLTEYFSMCKHHSKAREFMYHEFPEHYVWNAKNRCWYERKKGQVIGRINGAHLAEGERYYLRLLLNHTRGPTSFDDLLTVNSFWCSTFKEAAIRRGLLESDKSISECMDEAIAYQMPYALRRLFATILANCEPTDVKSLWNTYSDALSEDFKRQNLRNSQGMSDESAKVKALASIEVFLESMGKKMSDYDLPRHPSGKDYLLFSSREIQDEMSIETSVDDQCLEMNLNNEQHAAFAIIVERVKSGKPGVFFVDGPGGTGKTYLYRAILAHLRSKDFICIATATTGVAAHILPGGRTAHSRFKIPLEANDTTVCSFKKQSGLGDLLRATKLIIWDEAPMAKRWAIETLDRTMRDVVGNMQQWFGGKVVVFGGDYRQVLPVVPKGTIHQTINASLVKSNIWQIMEKFNLSENMRARVDPTFSEFLLRVGNGEEPTNEEGNIKLPQEMVVEHDNNETSEQRLIDMIFPSLGENGYSLDYMSKRAILAPKNEHVDMLNNKLIAQFQGEERVYTSFDEAIDDTHNYYTEEFLNSLSPNGIPPHKLVLKINCPAMLLRNLDPADGMCNGTRMLCRNFEPNVIHAEIIDGTHAGKQVFIPRIPLLPKESDGYPFKFKKKQFPIRLCFAMTINKAQGQTIPNVGVYLPQPVFSHGQLYVALSRGTSMSTTKVLVKPEASNTKGYSWTKNVVYKEVLRSCI